jgi:prepilin-type N-terminal cleavage/methylation domain-containing protein
MPRPAGIERHRRSRGKGRSRRVVATGRGHGEVPQQETKTVRRTGNNALTVQQSFGATLARMTHAQRNGFTLIELSIVLVIIGLIVGAILVGRDLVAAAQYRRAVSDLENLKTSIATFKNKYNCLPGDCANATAFFSCADDYTTPWSGNYCNGDGDGLYDSDGTSSNATYEGTLRIWEQLSDAGLPFLGTYTGVWTNDAVTGWVRGVNTPKLPWGGNDPNDWPIGIYLTSATYCWWGAVGDPITTANPLPKNTIVLDGINPSISIQKQMMAHHFLGRYENYIIQVVGVGLKSVLMVQVTWRSLISQTRIVRC